MNAQPNDPLKVFLITGEVSGDALGGALMEAITGRSERPVEYCGVGGATMRARGLESIFPLDELSLMGVGEIVIQLPRILGLISRTVRAVVEEKPDVLVLIDSPDFTHTVAKRVRKRLPDLLVVNYVSPTVWAWRSGRARRMRRYIDRVLAIFPFEVAAHERLSGPPCVYVGHPLIGRVGELGGAGEGRLDVGNPPNLLVMPGSRSSEITRLMEPFGAAVAQIRDAVPDVEVTIPVVPGVRDQLEAALAGWPLRPDLVHTEAEKFAAYRRADAALVASGTATLELALAKVPMVAGYRIEWLASLLKWMLNVPSVLLPNLIAGENFVPEYIHRDCTADNLAMATIALLRDSETRRRQLNGFRTVAEKLQVGAISPSARAAGEILDLVSQARNG